MRVSTLGHLDMLDREAHAGVTRSSTLSYCVRVSEQVAFMTRPRAGEIVNGDRALILEQDEYRAFVVVDALGHGPPAHEAAAIAELALERVELARGTLDIMQHLHEAMHGSRGAAITMVLQHESTLEACGVGNVGLRLEGAQLPFVASPGVVGRQVRRFRVADGEVASRARLYLYSDGISERFRHHDFRNLAPRNACEAVLERHGKSHDDATVMIADLLSPHLVSRGSSH